jgi:hypothetical protein
MAATYANVSDVPLALAVFLASDSYDYNDDPFTISATTLLKPLRQVILPGRIPAGEGLPELAAQFKNRLGAAIHDAIERAWKDNYVRAMTSLGYPRRVIDRIAINPPADLLTKNPDLIPVYLEQRLQRKLGKWTITGKFDFIGEGKVQDFKSTSTFTYKNQVNADKYTQQGSIYRWLDPKKITANEMEIHYLFTDWKAGMVRIEPGYPPKPFVRQVFPLLSLGDTERFIKNKIAAIETYIDAPEEEIPPCTDEDLWRSEPQFKYYKNGDVTAKRSTKNFDSRQDAVIYMTTEGKGLGAIKEVPGQVTACKYCPAFLACTQKDELIRNGELLMGA